jgi:hypothetical protein
MLPRAVFEQEMATRFEAIGVSWSEAQEAMERKERDDGCAGSGGGGAGDAGGG